MDIADYANSNPQSSRLSALNAYFKEESLLSAIDNYRTAVRTILNYGTPATLTSNQFLGRLLVLGILSAAEGYFQSILSSCIEVCPVSQSTSSEKMINLGGLLWHGKSNFSRSAFEHATFTSKKELKQACKDFIGFALEEVAFSSLLDEYDKVCQIRHGIVHNDGFLPGRNAVRLDIQKFNNPVRINIGYAQLQDICAVIDALIFTFNRELFAEMCKRWAVDWRKRADWEPVSETVIFAKLWSTFHSADERRLRVGRSKISRSLCLAEVRTLYGI